MQYVVLLLLHLYFIYVTSNERMAKGSGVFCSDKFPICHEVGSALIKGTIMCRKKPHHSDVGAFLTVCLTAEECSSVFTT